MALRRRLRVACSDRRDDRQVDDRSSQPENYSPGPISF
jgi:hypothetical protein